VDIKIYFEVHWHPCGGPGRTASSVQVYTHNNVIAAEQNFMKFGTGEFVKNCGAITVFFYVGWLF
jgi:hypothetical protein